MQKNGKGIPEKWDQYTNMGQQIPGTRLIPFKVPLKYSLLNNLNMSTELFDVRSVMDHCSNLGLVIDLTNTDRYYDPKEFLENDVSYYKLKTFGNIPVDNLVFKFYEVMAWFLEKNRSNGKLIGVHCTNGVNKTGYMIIRYMIQQLNVPPDVAISAFNSARGHALEKEDYLDDLRKALWPKSPNFPIRRLSNSSQQDPKSDIENVTDQTPPYFPTRSKFRKSQNEDFHLSRNRDGAGPYSTVGIKRRLSGVYSHLGNSEFSFDTPNVQSKKRPFSELEFSETNGSSSGFDKRRLGFSSERRSSSSRFDKRRLSYEPVSPISVFDKRRLGPELDNMIRPIYDVESNKNSLLPIPGDPLPINFADTIAEAHKLGVAYYEQYFGDRAYTQYDSDFYSGGGGGIGPHRPAPRSLPSLPPNDGMLPRVYRGPKPYHPPPPPVEELELIRTPQRHEPFLPPYFSRSPVTRLEPLPVVNKSPGDFLVPVDGPRRSIFSPGTRNNVFSPETDWSPRLRSSRFQPY